MCIRDRPKAPAGDAADAVASGPKKRTRAPRKPKGEAAAEASALVVAEAAPEAAPVTAAGPAAEVPAEAPKKRTRAPRKAAATTTDVKAEVKAPAKARAAAKAPAKTAAADLPPLQADPGEAKPAGRRLKADPDDTAPIASAMPDLVADPGDTPTPGTRLQPDPAEADAGKPRRKGWWSLKK